MTANRPSTEVNISACLCAPQFRAMAHRSSSASVIKLIDVIALTRCGSYSLLAYLSCRYKTQRRYQRSLCASIKLSFLAAFASPFAQCIDEIVNAFLCRPECSLGLSRLEVKRLDSLVCRDLLDRLWWREQLHKQLLLGYRQ